jgi:hypothetical protein
MAAARIRLERFGNLVNPDAAPVTGDVTPWSQISVEA